MLVIGGQLYIMGNIQRNFIPIVMNARHYLMQLMVKTKIGWK